MSVITAHENTLETEYAVSVLVFRQVKRRVLTSNGEVKCVLIVYRCGYDFIAIFYVRYVLEEC